MSVELLNAYISISAETSQIPKQVKAALGQADGQAARAGKSIGDKMSGAMGKALKRGALAAGAAGVATVGTAMVKGFQRLDAIDQAKAKLAGLGNSASDVEKVMGNALASVKGTAYGLGDAASLAGVMVAAGIKPGQELESTLKRVADTAAIAGTDLNDVGQIWGKVAAKGKVDGQVVNQMLERQIPIYEILSKHYKKQPEEIAEMVSKGKVSFKDFSDAMNAYVGGAALKSGETFKGAFANLGAALGRVGASVLEPFFKPAIGGMNSLTGAIDAAEPKLKALAASFGDKVFTEWGPKLRDALSAARNSKSLDSLLQTFRGLADAGMNIAPALLDIGKSLATASAAIGVGTWQLFEAALNSVAQTLHALSPLLSALASVMQAHPGLVTAAVAAWAGFKTIPSIIGRVTDATRPMVSSIDGARGAFRSFGETYRTSVGYMRQANPQISATGAHLGVLRGNAVAAGKALSNTLKGGVNSVVGALGGPMSAALIGAGALFMMVSSKNQAAEQSAQAYSSAVDKSREAQIRLNEALRDSRGAIDENVTATQAQAVTAYMEELEAATTRTGSALDAFRAEGESFFSMNSMFGGYARTQAQAYDDMADSAKGSIEAIKGLGLSTEELAAKVYGSKSGFDALTKQLRASGQNGAEAAKRLAVMREEFLKQKGIAEKVSPGIKEVASAMEVLGDKSSTAADKLKAIKTAMDALNPARSKAEAIKQMGEAIRQAAEAASGIGPDAFNASGALDAMTESGGKLSEVLTNLADKQAQVASTGDAAAIARTNKEIETTLQSLANATNQPIEKIRELYSSFGGGENINLMVQLSGASETTQQIGAIIAKMNAVPNSKTVTIEPGLLSKQTLEVLDKIGIKTTTLPDGSVNVDVTGDAAKKLQEVINTANRVPKGKAVVTTAPGGQAVYDLLKAMGVEVSTNNEKNIVADIPNGSPVLQLLRDIGYEVQTRNGKTIIVKADDTDYQGKKLEWTEDVYKRIIAQGVNFGDAAPGGGVFRGPGIAENADGGVTVDRFASGGLKQIEKPTKAAIYRGRGAGTIFAEQETGGEAYIPLAAGKRRRSTNILATVAEMFGLALVPQDSISGTFGDLASRAVSGLFKRAGADNITRYADGGIALRELADGKGASRPLTGAPYVWGGVNWGDCSGAMSAFARAAVGLDPFGGRFATASQGDYLRKLGFRMGRGGPGDLRFGWGNDGPGGGHTAGTLPDGTNIEMGGSYGGGMLGGSVGSDDPQFTDHAYLPMGDAAANIPGYERPGDEHVDDPNYRPGNQSGGDYSSPGSGEQSISGRFGAAASAFVAGQISDILNVLNINDTPGFLGAIAELENQKKKPEVTAKPKGDNGQGKKEYEDAKLRSKQEFEAEKLKRKQKYEAEQAKLKADLEAKKIGRSEYDSKIAELKKKFDETELQKKQEYDSKALEAKQKYDELQRSQRNQPGATSVKPPSDPGSSKPGKGEDLGGSSDDPRSAVKRAFNPFGWDAGQFWTDTDYIVNKESSWNPTAKNPSSTAYGLFQFLDETWATVGATKTDDPFLQGQAGQKYIAQRYSDPSKAKAFWEKNGWYDKGGIADGVGFMAKGTLKPERILDPRETIAFEKMVDANFSPGIESAPTQSWRPPVNITNQVTVSNERSQMRELRRMDKRTLMQYGGARP